ncbi:MAG: uroporphyrinogen-III C-methyltransferase [Nevskia sp.]|nr:uroporphyrinogen-III C-methyltransferase [Nevskia sp.]
MTEYDAPPPPRGRRTGWIAGIALALLLVGLAGLGGWRLWRFNHNTEEVVSAQDTLLRRLSHELADLQAETEQLRERQADFATAQHDQADDLARLQSRAGDSEQALARLSADFNGGRTRAQLVAVEQLLLLANDRVQLARDAAGAATALQLADDRLSTLAEPKLFEVRKAVAQERAALQAVHSVDRAAAALSLGELIARAPALPLRERPVRQPVAQTAAAAAAQERSGGWWSRGWSSLRDMLAAVFIVRRTDKPVERLLPPEQEALVMQLYALKLESARAALLLGDTAAFRGALDSALQWLADYYRPEDPAVEAAHAELERLRTLELAPPLPDLSRSVGLLRAYLDAMPR